MASVQFPLWKVIVETLSVILTFMSCAAWAQRPCQNGRVSITDLYHTTANSNSRELLISTMLQTSRTLAIIETSLGALQPLPPPLQSLSSPAPLSLPDPLPTPQSLPLPQLSPQSLVTLLPFPPVEEQHPQPLPQRGVIEDALALFQMRREEVLILRRQSHDRNQGLQNFENALQNQSPQMEYFLEDNRRLPTSQTGLIEILAEYVAMFRAAITWVVPDERLQQYLQFLMVTGAFTRILISRIFRGSAKKRG